MLSKYIIKQKKGNFHSESTDFLLQLLISRADDITEYSVFIVVHQLLLQVAYPRSVLIESL